MDEQPDQLIDEVRIPIPAKPGCVQKYDSEYRRDGTVSNFMFFQPLQNWCRVSVREHRRRKDWAAEVARLLDEEFPDAVKVVLVMDNLNTHTLGSLCAKYPPDCRHRDVS